MYRVLVALFVLVNVPAIIVGVAAAESELPRVLLVGDSIASGYTRTVEAGLKGQAVVVKNPGNAGSTATALAKPTVPKKKPKRPPQTDAAGQVPDPTAYTTNLDYYLAHGPFDMIHFNWGLHDLAHGGIPEDRYIANLTKLVDRLKETKAILIFATTTPVPPKNAHGRVPENVVAFNTAATALMKKKGVLVNDLYTHMLPQMEKLGLTDNVHFTGEGYRFLGEHVTAAITKAMATRK